MTDAAGDLVEEADGIRVGLCAHCESVHVFLSDASDVVFASARISPEQWDQIVAAVAEQRRAFRANDSIGPAMGRA